MSMTMRVYEVGGKTGQFVRERSLVAVTPGENAGPLMTSAFPPCQCPRCRAKGNRYEDSR